MGSSPKAVLVTGAGKRIGRAIALALGRSGWAVAVHYNQSAAEAAAVVGEIVGAGGKATAIRADLLSEAEVSGLVEAAAGELGPLGCLINNASVFRPDSAGSATQASWHEHMMVNLRAPLVLSQAFARQMPGGADGCIINLLDERVWNLTPHFLSYTVSKAGLWTLTRTLALSFAPHIRVNAIGPGPVLPSTYQTPEQFARLQAGLPLQRGTTPEEVAAAVGFLLAAPSITGQMIALDGGQHLGWAHASQDDPEAGVD